MKVAIYDPNHDFIGHVELDSEHPGTYQRTFYACIDSLAKQALWLKRPISVFGQEIDTKIVDFIQENLEYKLENALDFYIQPAD